MEFSDRSNPFKYKAHYNATVKAYYAPLSQVVNIVQPEHGTIQVLYNNTYYTESFVIKKSDSIKVFFLPDVGYIQSKITMNSQPISVDKEYIIDEDVTLQAETALKAYFINIIQSDGITLTVRKNNKSNYISAFYANYNDILDISYTIQKPGIDPLFTINDEVVELPLTMIVADDLKIETSSSTSRIRVIPVQVENATLKCLYNDIEYTSEFVVNYGDTITPIIEVNDGYHLTELAANNNSIISNNPYVVTEETTITSIVDVNRYTIIIQQPEYAKITGNCRGMNYESSFQIDHGDQASFTCIINEDVEDEYFVRNILLNGEPIKQNTKYRFTESSLISADIGKVEIVKTYKVTIPKVTGAVIYASYDNAIYTESFTAIEGYPITVWMEAEPQYNITSFKLNNETIPFYDRYVFTITKDSVLAASTKLKVYRMKLVNTTGGSIKCTMNGNAYTSDFDVVWGTSVTIEIVLNVAYNLTSVTLNGEQITNGSSHVITEDSEIRFTTALKRYEVQVVQPANGQITVNGQVGTSFTFTHGTEITVAITANSGYKVKSFTKTDL